MMWVGQEAACVAQPTGSPGDEHTDPVGLEKGPMRSRELFDLQPQAFTLAIC